MGKKNDIDEIMDEMDRKIQQWCDYTLKRLNEETSKAMDAAYKDFGIYQQRVITEIFWGAVDQFYSDYTPSEYQRTYGLFDVLDLDSNLDEYGMVVTGVKGFGDLFDATKMHKDRKGNDLFDKVFMHGWHGGAENINTGAAAIWGNHPSPGIPYYRTYGWVQYPNSSKKRWHRYGSWGQKAIQTKPPYKIFKEHMTAIERGEMLRTFVKISNEHNDKAVTKVQKEATDYGNKLFK